MRQTSQCHNLLIIDSYRRLLGLEIVAVCKKFVSATLLSFSYIALDTLTGHEKSAIKLYSDTVTSIETGNVFPDIK